MSGKEVLGSKGGECVCGAQSNTTAGLNNNAHNDNKILNPLPYLQKVSARHHSLRIKTAGRTFHVSTKQAFPSFKNELDGNRISCKYWRRVR